MSRIICNGIEKSFNKIKVLEHISFAVEEGELVSLLGPSGCGKTTILKIIAGLVKPDKGEIKLGDNIINKIPVEKRGTVIVFQDYLLFPHLNVEENIGFGLKMSKVAKKDIKIQVKKMLELVQLEGYNKKYPHELSGGQKQRIALARALAIEPKVLLLDEPFSNLDTKLRQSMREFTLDIHKKLNITTLLVTHDQEEAMMLSDKIAIMLDGKIKQFGAPKDLYQSPNSIEVADFFGKKNYIQGSVINGIFTSKILSFRTKKEDCKEAKAMIKPGDIKISKKKADLNGIVKFSRYAGEKVYHSILVGDIELKAESSQVIDVGEQVGLQIDYDKIIIFN